MPNYVRNWVPGGTYFFTVALRDRHADLLTRYVDALREAMRATRVRYPFSIIAIVVLPDHSHCLWTLPPGDHDFATRWKSIKSRFSRAVPRTALARPDGLRTGERGLWQRRYWEHTIRDEGDLANHIDYIHINPVKHGHVSRAADWPHSSIHRFIADGIVSSDWATEIADSAFGEPSAR